jgi:hypothetical protein
MKKTGQQFQLSASDLIGYLNCRAVAEGTLSKPKVWDPLLDILRERGAIHEQSYVDHLKAAGFEAVKIDGVDVSESAVAETLAAMKQGVPVIVQGALADNGWGKLFRSDQQISRRNLSYRERSGTRMSSSRVLRPDKSSRHRKQKPAR